MAQSLRQSIRRLAGTFQRRAERASDFTLRIGTVSTSDAGASTDGTNAVTVNLRGAVQQTPWIRAYTSTSPPAPDDMVAVALIDKSPLILGKVVGLPDF